MSILGLNLPALLGPLADQLKPKRPDDPPPSTLGVNPVMPKASATPGEASMYSAAPVGPSPRASQPDMSGQPPIGTFGPPSSLGVSPIANIPGPPEQEQSKPQQASGGPLADYMAQHPQPQLHGAKKVLDVVGGILSPNIEAAIPGSPGNYRRGLAQAEDLQKNVMGVQKEQAGIDYSKAETAEKAGRLKLDQAQADRAEKLANNPAQAKVAFHFADPQGNETAVFEDGTTKTFPGGTPAKPEDIKAMYAQAVDSAIKSGKDPNSDPAVQRLAKASQNLVPEKPDKSEKPQQQLMVGPDGKVIEARPGMTLPKGTQTIGSERPEKPPGAAANKFDETNATNASKDVETARGSDFRLRTMQSNLTDALKGNQQAMVSLLTNHVGMTLGLQKGARITKDILHEAQASAPWLQVQEAKWGSDGYLSGVTLSPQTMRQMVDLGVSQRVNAWQQAMDSADQAGVRNKVKVPDDLKGHFNGASAEVYAKDGKTLTGHVIGGKYVPLEK